MIYEANIHTREKLVTMFEDFNNVVLLSYLQGHMGTAWVNDLENPTVAQITVGIFTFYAGDSKVKETEELLRNIPDRMLVIVNSVEWKKRLETFYERKIDKFYAINLNVMQKFLIVQNYNLLYQRFQKDTS